MKGSPELSQTRVKIGHRERKGQEGNPRPHLFWSFPGPLQSDYRLFAGGSQPKPRPSRPGILCQSDLMRVFVKFQVHRPPKGVGSLQTHPLQTNKNMRRLDFAEQPDFAYPPLRAPVFHPPSFGSGSGDGAQPEATAPSRFLVAVLLSVVPFQSPFNPFVPCRNAHARTHARTRTHTHDPRAHEHLRCS